jgi:hypothetical protein
MLRRLAMTAVVLAVNAFLAGAQGHPGSHLRPASHDSLQHAPMDSAQHAALHALIHGTWTGTISDHASTSPLKVSIARDSLHAAIVAGAGGSPMTLGAAHRWMAAARDTVRWIQEVSGMTCATTAAVRSNGSGTPTMEGVIACPNRELHLTLRKAAE